MRQDFFEKFFKQLTIAIEKSSIFVPNMTICKRHITLILLLIMALCFNACRNRLVPEEIIGFENNFNSDSQQLDRLAKMADSCAVFYASDPSFLEKMSQIYYQKGVSHHKNNESLDAARALITACKSQQSFLSIENRPTNDDYHYLGQIFERLGDVYADVNSLKPSSHFYDDALSQYENANRQHEVIDMLLKIGDLYQRNHIPNIALINYETAEAKKNLTEHQSDIIQIKKGIALYDVFDTESADSIYRKISTKNPHNIEYQHFTACHFYNANQYSEALPHLLNCFEQGNQNMKLQSAEMLASVYFSLNDHQKELEFAQYQAKAQSAEARLTPTRVEMEALYEQYINENNPKNLENSGNLRRSNWILTIVVVLLIILMVAIYIVYSRRSKNNTPSTDETLPSLHPFDDNYKCFVGSNIYNDIKNSLEGKQILIKTVSDYPRLALTKNKLVTLTTTFNESFPNLTHTLLELYPDLTPSDIRFIIFSLMGFTDLEIAVLLKQTYGSANKRSNRIKDILHTEEELEHFIPSFLRGIRY